MKRFWNILIYIIFGTVIFSSGLTVLHWQSWALLSILAVSQMYAGWSIYDDIRKTLEHGTK